MNPADIQTFVKEHDRIHIVGNRTKSALAITSPDVNIVSLAGLTGITEYQPEEYTVTAYAGTPVHELQAELRKNRQYLPFDPILPKSASVGGTVATNLSGSRRYRYGGVRDFILWMQVIDGLGRTFRCGARVVKNSAGFDLPKFFVGSLGEFAILTEVTFKIFPEAPAFTTLQFQFDSLEDVLSALFFINRNIFELDALDFETDGDRWFMLVRMIGQSETLLQRSQRFVSALQNATVLRDFVEWTNDASRWEDINDLSWTGTAKNVIKVALSPRQIPAMDADIRGLASSRRYSIGGNVAWIATDNVSAVDAILQKHQLTGLPVIGQAGSRIIGKPVSHVLSDRVKQVLDPQNKFV